MTPQRERCPYCGIRKFGLQDHIRARHGADVKGIKAKIKADILAEATRASAAELIPDGPRTTKVIKGTTYRQARLDCPECGQPMELRPSPLRNANPVYYACVRRDEGCPGAHGAHPDGSPLGTPADQATKRMRIAAHKAFDPLWKGPAPHFSNRRAAYAWMRSTLGLTDSDGHIAKFDKAMCAKLIRACHQLTAPELPLDFLT